MLVLLFKFLFWLTLDVICNEVSNSSTDRLSVCLIPNVGHDKISSSLLGFLVSPLVPASFIDTSFLTSTFTVPYPTKLCGAGGSAQLL